MRICVYCASSQKIHQDFFDSTEVLAREFVENKVEVVFGGGATGLMGKLADTVLEHGGKIKGIMPKFMNEVEWAHKSVADFEFTETMHERKAKFLVDIDGVVALPGGSGTLEELLEVITFKRLGLFTKPIVILNARGYYDPLKEMLERCVTEKFMNKRHQEMWSFVNNPQDVLDSIKNASEWGRDAINYAQTK